MLATPLALLTTVWTTHATIKVRPADPPAATSSIALAAARNEFEAFQVVINGGTSGANGVRMTFSLAGLPSTNVWLYREALLDLTMPSNPSGATGWWPDPLVPDRDEVYGEQRNAFPFDVPAGENRAVWIDVLVPQNQPPGIYSGAVHVSAAGGFAADVPVTLEVWNFTLPSTPSLHSAFGSAWDGACVAHYGQPCDDAGTIASKLLYAKFALDHRLTISDTVYDGPYSSGGGYDWASWDAIYAPLFDGTATTRLPGARMTNIQYIWQQTRPAFAAWAQHFRQRGWLDRTYSYTCDEPPLWGCGWADILQLAGVVHQADPGLRTLVTTSLLQAQQNGVDGVIDILVPVVDEMNPHYPDVSKRSSYASWQAGAPQRQIWWYFGCEPGASCSNGVVGGAGGWPNYIVDAPAIENRIMGFLSYRYGIDTELYYDVMAEYVSGNPWQSVYAYGNNGDGTLLYPGKPSIIGGTHDIPVASIRFKMIREAREDYEYLKMLADAGDPALASSLAQTVAARTWQFAEDPSVLYDARRRAAERIVALQTPPSPDGGTSGGDGGMPPTIDAGTPPLPDAGMPTTIDAAASPAIDASVAWPGSSFTPGAGAAESGGGGCTAAGAASDWSAPMSLALIALVIATRAFRRSRTRRLTR